MAIVHDVIIDKAYRRAGSLQSILVEISRELGQGPDGRYSFPALTCSDGDGMITAKYPCGAVYHLYQDTPDNRALFGMNPDEL